jgi:hypothetical protein
MMLWRPTRLISLSLMQGRQRTDQMVDEVAVIEATVGPYKGQRLTMSKAEAQQAIADRWAIDPFAPAEEPKPPKVEPKPPTDEESAEILAKAHAAMAKLRGEEPPPKAEEAPPKPPPKAEEAPTPPKPEETPPKRPPKAEPPHETTRVMAPDTPKQPYRTR